MTIKQLLQKLEYTNVQGTEEKEITAVVYDSRKIVEGCMFICIEGANFDGHSMAEEAAKKGAAALIVSKPVDLKLIVFRISRELNSHQTSVRTCTIEVETWVAVLPRIIWIIKA